MIHKLRPLHLLGVGAVLFLGIALASDDDLEQTLNRILTLPQTEIEAGVRAVTSEDLFKNVVSPGSYLRVISTVRAITERVVPSLEKSQQQLWLAEVDDFMGSNPDLVQQAARQLAPVMFGYLSSVETVVEAASILKETADPLIAEQMWRHAQRVSTPYAQARIYAAASEMLGSAAWPKLRTLLDSPSRDLVNVALYGLAESRDPRVIAMLKMRFDEGESQILKKRAHLFDAMLRSGDPELLQWVSEEFEDEEFPDLPANLRIGIRNGRYPDAVSAALTSQPSSWTMALVASSKTAGAGAYLNAVLMDPKEDEYFKTMAAYALSDRSDAFDQLLLAQAQSENVPRMVRIAAMLGLIHAGMEDDVQEILKRMTGGVSIDEMNRLKDILDDLGVDFRREFMMLRKLVLEAPGEQIKIQSSEVICPQGAVVPFTTPPVEQLMKDVNGTVLTAAVSSARSASEGKTEKVKKPTSWAEIERKKAEELLRMLRQFESAQVSGTGRNFKSQQDLEKYSKEYAQAKARFQSTVRYLASQVDATLKAHSREPGVADESWREFRDEVRSLRRDMRERLDHVSPDVMYARAMGEQILSYCLENY